MAVTYVVYERTDEDTREVARVIDNEVTGEKAISIQKLLEDEGWPEKTPVRILNGIRLWAVLEKGA